MAMTLMDRLDAECVRYARRGSGIKDDPREQRKLDILEDFADAANELFAAFKAGEKSPRARFSCAAKEETGRYILSLRGTGEFNTKQCLMEFKPSDGGELCVASFELSEGNPSLSSIPEDTKLLYKTTTAIFGRERCLNEVARTMVRWAVREGLYVKTRVPAVGKIGFV